jgi:DNA-binding CsgD family transcriptional regulator
MTDASAALGPAQARGLFDSSRWNRCIEVLVEADACTPLGGGELTLLADAAYLAGRDEEALRAHGRAYQVNLLAGDWRSAARSALACSFVLATAGQGVSSGGWIARAKALVDEHDLGGAEEGRVRAEEAHRLMVQRDVAEALVAARHGELLGLQAGDADVVVLSRLTIGFALLVQQQRVEALRVMDEVMVAVLAEETSAAVVGLAYCSAIGICMMVRDMARAREWTTALTRWCDARPELIPYRGTCLIHRSQMMTLGGDWTGATEEALNAERLLRGRSAGDAAYQLGELARLRGEVDVASEHYRRANSLGRQPEPGLSRLKVAQGRSEQARTTLMRLCGERRPSEDRAELLAARVEAELSLADLDAARSSAAELASIAAELGTALVVGLSLQATGTVFMSAERLEDALEPLRGARQIWEELEFPHACAEVRLLLGRCLRGLGDEGSASLELEAARECFARLGAAAGVAVLDELTVDLLPLPSAGAVVAGLTAREVEVVRLVAAGHTNRVIASRLRLSEKTVARHLSNIYAKLDLPSRAAATAYAYDHGIV